MLTGVCVIKRLPLLNNISFTQEGLISVGLYAGRLLLLEPLQQQLLEAQCEGHQKSHCGNIIVLVIVLIPCKDVGPYIISFSDYD